MLDLLGATPARAAGSIVSASLGPVYRYNTNAMSHYLYGDTFANCWADDGILYFAPNDTFGINNQDSAVGGEKLFFGTLPNSPDRNPATEINNFRSLSSLNVGPQGSSSTLSGESSPHAWGTGGMICLSDGTIYLGLSRFTYSPNSETTPQYGNTGNVIYTLDKGRNWTSNQGYNTLPGAGSNAMFYTGGTGEGFAPYFIEHGQNNRAAPSSSNGFSILADQYVYACDTGAFFNADHVLLGRVPSTRSAIMNPSAWQFYAGPTPITGHEGESSGNWSSNLYSATPIFSAPTRTSFCEIRYVPGLRKYLLLSYYYPNDGPQETYGYTASTVWTFFQSDTPWGPWSLFYTASWDPQGYYLPTAPSMWMAADGSSLWLGFAGDYSTGSAPPLATLYTFNFAQLTLQTSGNSPNLLSNPGFESGTFGAWSASGASVVAGNAHSGAYSCQIVGGPCGCWQSVSGLTPGRTYTLAAWLQVGTGATGAYLFAKGFGGAQVVSPTITTSGYSFTALHFTPTGTSATIGAWQDYGSGSAWVDDFALM